MVNRFRWGAIAGLVSAGLASPVTAQETGGAWVNPKPRPSLNFYGETGLIDMPTGESQPVGELNITSSYFRGALRNTINFQITNRLSGSFRYSVIPDYNVDSSQYDRSFDLRFRVLDEGKYVPAVTVGLRDFGGTGIYGGEYIVATKNPRAANDKPTPLINGQVPFKILQHLARMLCKSRGVCARVFRRDRVLGSRFHCTQHHIGMTLKLV